MIEGARTLNARTSMKTDYELEFVFNIIDLSTFCKKVFPHEISCFLCCFILYSWALLRVLFSIHRHGFVIYCGH